MSERAAARCSSESGGGLAQVRLVLALVPAAQLHKLIGQHWTLNLNLAVRKLWHAAIVLGFQPDTLDPKHVAMTAATYLSRTPSDVLSELTAKAGS